jgi:hypothetical protein
MTLVHIRVHTGHAGAIPRWGTVHATTECSWPLGSELCGLFWPDRFSVELLNRRTRRAGIEAGRRASACPCTADEIHQGQRIVGACVSPPGHMLIGTREYELPGVEVGHLARVDIDNGEGYAPLPGCFD